MSDDFKCVCVCVNIQRRGGTTICVMLNFKIRHCPFAGTTESTRKMRNENFESASYCFSTALEKSSLQQANASLPTSLRVHYQKSQLLRFGERGR